MPCMTKTGSSTWSRPCTHDYSCGLSLCFPPIVGPCHWGCDDWRWCFVRPVLPKIQPMSCDDDFMPIFPALWELLLRTVFQDWIVDDGNYYPSCGNPYGNYDPLTILVKVRLKSLLAVCSVVNSAGQWVLFVKKEKQSSVCCKKSTIWDQFLRNEAMNSEQVPHLFSYIGLQTFFALHFCPWDTIAAILINPYKPRHFWARIIHLINNRVWFWNCTNPLVYY